MMIDLGRGVTIRLPSEVIDTLRWGGYPDHERDGTAIVVVRDENRHGNIENTTEFLRDSDPPTSPEMAIERNRVHVIIPCLMWDTENHCWSEDEH